MFTNEEVFVPTHTVTEFWQSYRGTESETYPIMLVFHTDTLCDAYTADEWINYALPGTVTYDPADKEWYVHTGAFGWNVSKIEG